MRRKILLIANFCISLLLLGGCISDEPSIINRYAEAHLNNKNELEFRFKLNDKIFTDEKMYKVKVLIHDEELAAALGGEEIIYGSKEVPNGKTLDVSQGEEFFIYMDPIPMLVDLHVFEIEKMIKDEKAISVEIISNDEVIAKAFLTNFTSQI
ncbi:hypothetical protein R4Z10_14360 [Niallia sp. XMNu-256]|uniref:hypothetical protein n=1 Tax=Niallia sp. XMNu-256 TaxID=3082444 RepID=UPI0030D34576